MQKFIVHTKLDLHVYMNESPIKLVLGLLIEIFYKYFRKIVVFKFFALIIHVCSLAIGGDKYRKLNSWHVTTRTKERCV